ncbi:hypothetical protein [Bacillus sp. AFS017336]|uniref:hypothetical protein n=1 Tax=Bacillus sp. AFS017336 TaxID=2033489 RepID=UPI000BEF9467|nr:hypothetical protein [Bacillus sp. AFS017336]PEL13020.1 hypothetical protein CN601_05905 [Bacillus sp. AFS017336]
MKDKGLNISLSFKVSQKDLEEINRFCEENDLNRSAFIRKTVFKEMERRKKAKGDMKNEF